MLWLDDEEEQEVVLKPGEKLTEYECNLQLQTFSEPTWSITLTINGASETKFYLHTEFLQLLENHPEIKTKFGITDEMIERASKAFKKLGVVLPIKPKKVRRPRSSS